MLDPRVIPDPKFKANLVEYIDGSQLDRLGYETVQLVDEDDGAREQWRTIMTECIAYLGVGSGRSSSGLTFPKETNFYSPTLRKVVLQMSCKIHQTLFPAGNYIKTIINGDSSSDIADRAARMEYFVNHFLRDILKDYKSDKESLIEWLVICGSAFSKAYIDPIRGLPVAYYVQPDEIIISPDATCLENAERVTHRIKLNKRKWKELVKLGLYRDVSLSEDEEGGSSLGAHAKKSMGIDSQNIDDKDKSYLLYECMRWADLKGFEHQNANGHPTGRPLPYLVTVDKGSQKVVSIYRNWEEGDVLFKRKSNLTQYKLYTGFGPYGRGMAHTCLDLAKAETQMMQELVRAAELSNQPSLLQSSGATRNEKTQILMTPGSVNRVDVMDNNINNAFYPLPTREPSQTLLTLMQSVTQSIMDISTAREITPENMPANTAATTMMGMLSTMHILEDSVMNRLYDSFSSELSLLFKLLGDWLPTSPYPFSVPGGQQAIMKNDFTDDMVIVPTIDPNVASQAYQLITNDTLMALSSANPDLYDVRAIHERALRAMRVNNIDEILKPVPDDTPPPPPPLSDPVTENQNMLQGQPVKVYKTQDQASHLAVHKDFLSSTQSQAEADDSKASVIAAIQSHITDHEAMAYLLEMEARMGMQIPDDPTQVPPDVQDQIAFHAAQALLQKQQEDQAANPPPIDPQTVLMEEVQVKKAYNEQKGQLDQLRIQMESHNADSENQLAQAKIQLENRRIDLEEKKVELEYQKIAIQAKIEQNKLVLDNEELNYKKEFNLRKFEEESKIKAANLEKDVVEAADLLRQKQAETLSKAEIEDKKLAVLRENKDLDTEVKAYDATLRSEKEKHNDLTLKETDE